MSRFRGIGVALATPFDNSGQIDFTALARLLEHTAIGVDYYVVLGTTGESVTTSEQEKAKILKFVKENNPHKLPIVFGIGSNNTAHAIEEIEKTNLDGVTGVLSVSPYYNKPSQEGIFRHFEALADVSPVPLILYNVPGRTASNINAETTIRLAAHRNIAGIKEASGNIEQCLQIARDKPNEFALISGDDLLTLPLMSIGGVGVISVLANAYPMIFKKMIDFFVKGDHKAAAAEAYKLAGINSAMYEEGSPTGLKQLLKVLGICGNAVRLPMAPASDQLSRRIQEAANRII